MSTDTTRPIGDETVIQTLIRKGGRVDWLGSGEQWISFDRRGQDGYYDVWQVAEDGSGEECLTGGAKGLPARNNGQPAWHPSGRYLVFQAEKAESTLTGITTPGAGVLNDLWLMDLETRAVWRIREVSGRFAGTLHPHFSHDGRRLAWSELYGPASGEPGHEVGLWKLMVADFEEEGATPWLSNITEYIPGVEGFHENHGFSLDGSKLIFTAPLEAGRSARLSNLWTLHLRDGSLSQLTHEGYNEHGQYSPDGSKIAWISGNGAGKGVWGEDYWGTEMWIMNADGSDKHQLTHANQPGHEHQSWSEGRAGSAIFADSSWHADGDRLIVLTLLAGEDGLSVVTGAKPRAESVLLVRPASRLLG
ncbi:MAG: TolB family protein [Acidobacteriota bacterium]